MNRPAARARLDGLWRRGREFLGVEYAILGGAMTWVSERSLVSALSNAGGFGVIACGAMTPDLLSGEIAATGGLTSQPYGVNLITLHPDLDALIDVCADHRVSHVILAGGLPPATAIGRIKASGARVLCFAPTLAVARRLVRLGADAIVIEGAEAGGHVGPVATSVLAQEILPNMDQVPVFIAGGIGRGDAILGYLELGGFGLPARHPVRLRDRVDRPSRLQARLHPRLRARRRDLGSDRSGLPGDAGARAAE